MSTSYEPGERSASSATPADSRLLADRYEVGELLGRGGMSDVWRSRDMRLGRDVAIKILRADLVRDESFQQRFRGEAGHSAALNHPAIVAVYDTGETDGPAGPTPFIVMEYVEGRTLRQVLDDDGRIDPQHTLTIMADVCTALDFSHCHGIIHRDVKPGNIMLDDAGAVKVMDFGIARAAHEAGAGMTLPTAVIGTAHYLSPEQIRGQQVDARSDVYAAGCTMYELLTGRPPFTGDSLVAVTYQQLQETPPPPSALHREISSGIDAVVLKALTKGPANRYQSAVEMRSDLARVLANKQPNAPKILAPETDTSVRRPRRIRPAPKPTRVPAKRSRAAQYFAVFATVSMLLFVLWHFNPFAGAPTAAIPRISGQPYLVAESQLRDLGFDIIKRHVVPCWARSFGTKPPCDTKRYGRVLGTKPREGTTVATSTVVVVDVGKAPRQFEMPDLAGKKTEAVRKILAQSGLLLNPDITLVENTIPRRSGQVITQHPAPGEDVAQGDTVTLSAYERPVMVPVVDYTGQSDEAARAALTSVGFQVTTEWVQSAEPAGTVIGQDPRSGEAAAGTTVVLTVSDGSDGPMDMPYVIGMTPQEARAALADAGHVGGVDLRAYRLDESHRQYAGLVVATYPDYDDTLRRSDPVTLYVGEYQREEPPPPAPTTSTSEPPPTGPPVLPQPGAGHGRHGP